MRNETKSYLTLSAILMALIVSLVWASIYKTYLVLAILAILTVLVGLALAGALTAHQNLEGIVLRELKKQGGQMQFNDLKNIFARHCTGANKNRESEDMLSDALDRLQEKGLVRNSNGVIQIL